ncbi:MAG: serine--tRNA ligase [Proteobacteria bacterium]|jgi:seryl-tRNA synthetase|nr:serine--tRNA ligase [Pseudomonadota bacterium]NCA27820.1 serine--tRNA ligase [Pseudomonadota bacterium]
MIDIKFIRENSAQFDEAMQARGNSIRSQQILELDEKKRKKIQLIQELQAKRNKIAQEIAILKKNNSDASQILKESKKVNQQLVAEESDFTIDSELQEILLAVPNIPASDVVVGVDENDNIEIEKFGTPRNFDFTPQAHDAIGEKLQMLDFEQSAQMSGARFSTLSADLAHLERALANFMLDIAIEHNYTEISPPNLVKSEAMKFSGQLPKFSEEAFVTTDGYWLIPTSEVSLVNLVAKKTLQENQLPLRFTAFTPCYRREAGSAGKDTRGMIRQHQFKKVELVSITTQESSDLEHERMTSIACTILQKLNLPYRKILLCTGDMGFCSRKTYDIEVWMPSQNKYREISSCSNCGDFQSRRASIKYKNKDGKTFFAHTLNGSSLAVGRTLVAILENYQNADGSVEIPQALQSYMMGKKKISC